MRVQDGAPCGPNPAAGTRGSPGAGGCGCCKFWGWASCGRSRLALGQGCGHAMMCSWAVPRGWAVPHGCAMPHGWHWGRHMNSCSREAGLKRVWGGQGGAMHQTTACPLVPHPASVARGCLAQPSTQEGGCASSGAHPTLPSMGPCPGALHVPPTLHSQTTRLALTPGKGWTQHSHMAPWAHRGAEALRVLSTVPAGAPALGHSRVHCQQSPASVPSLRCSWDLPGGTEPLRTPKPLELELCSTHEPLTTPGTPLCSFGASAIAGGHSQPPKHGLEGRALLPPACRAGVGRGGSRSAPPHPGWWLLARAHAAPSHATSAWSLDVPRVPMALQHHPWPGRASAGQSQALRGLGALLPRGGLDANGAGVTPTAPGTVPSPGEE